MPSGESFAAVVEAARTGDPAAWETIYRAHAPAVLGYLRSQHPGVAEDLCSDTFAAACRDICQFDGSDDDLRRWLLTIARHRLLDQRRAEKVRPTNAGVEVADQQFLDTGFEHAEMRVDAHHRVEWLLAGLAPDQRAVLYLRYVLDLDQRDAAAVLGMSVAAVKMAQRRGSQKLAERINSAARGAS